MSERTKIRIGRNVITKKKEVKNEIKFYKKKDIVDFDVVIYMVTYERYDNIKKILSQFYGQSTNYTFKFILINDGSTDLRYRLLNKRYPDIIYIENSEYSYTYKQMWEYLKNIKTHVILQMCDGFILSDSFLDTILSIYFKKKYINNNMRGISPHTWSNKNEIEYESWWNNNNFVDGISLLDIEVVKYMKYGAIGLDTIVNEIGVWDEINDAVNRMGGHYHRTSKSLVYYDRLYDNNKIYPFTQKLDESLVKYKKTMKRKKIDIKKTIKKRIEDRHKQYLFIDKKNDKNKANTEINKNKTDLTDNIKIYNRTERRISNTNNTLHKRGNIDGLVHYMPILEEKQPVSIIITAFKSENFIEECLNSIENQTYFINNDNYEILIGVDGCQETLNKILKIRSKYRNLRVFMMKKNVGTFITTNTLINLMETDNFIRFDSDDEMLPQMINEIMYFNDEYDVVKFGYYNFNKSGYYQLKNNGNIYAAGVIFFKRKVFELYGGYQPWVCTAEGEILVRIADNLKIKNIDIGLFNRRVHLKSLTQSSETGMKSKLRKKYHKLIEISRQKKISLIKRVSTEYYECKKIDSSVG